MKSLLASLLFAIATPPTLIAQAIPAWTVDVLVGGGRHTERAGSVWYYPDATESLSLAGSLRLGGSGRIAPYLKVEVTSGIGGSYDAICKTAPNGSCFQHFPGNPGVGASVGMRGAFRESVMFGAGFGGGGSSDHLRVFVDADASARVGGHLALLGHARYERWTASGYNMWVAPISFGVRIF